MSQPSKTKANQCLEVVGDAVGSEALSATFELGFKALGEALSCAADVAVQCGSAAAEVACGVAGAALDGV